MSITDDTSRARPSGAGRMLPNDLQAEESLLGAMLLSRDAIAAATEILGADDFYKPAHGHVFDAIVTLNAAGEPADVSTVSDVLKRAGLLEAIGGPATLVNLQSATPATSNAARYAKIVEEHALLRRLIRTAGDIAEMGYGLPDDVTKAVDLAESMVFEVAQRRVTDSMSEIHDLLDANLDRLEQLYERGQSITGVPTGFTDLDELLSGLQPNALIVVGARPSAGKTALGLGMATHAALEAGRPVLIFSLEMSRLELTQRMLCSEAQGRLEAGAQRQPQRGRLAEDRPRHRTAGRGPHLDRRQPQPHHHGDPVQGSPAQGPHRRPRHGRGRLPPAHDRPHVRREPAGRGVRDQPRAQDPRPRARVPGGGALAAVARPRDAPGQAADAGRPARVGLPHRRHPHHPRRHGRGGDAR